MMYVTLGMSFCTESLTPAILLSVPYPHAPSWLDRKQSLCSQEPAGVAPNYPAADQGGDVAGVGIPRELEDSPGVQMEEATARG